MKPGFYRSLLACSAALALSNATTAFAQSPDGKQLEQRFAAADKDGDGKLTLEEATAGMPHVAKNFNRIDKDKKGHVTLEDLKASMASR